MTKRKLLQLHLSTCLVLMVLAGGLVWVNVRKVLTEEHEEFKNNISPMAVLARGWPWTFQSYWGPVIRTNEGGEFQYDSSNGGLNEWSLSFNILTALTILGAVGTGFEWCIRKFSPKQQKGMTPPPQYQAMDRPTKRP